MRCKIYNHDHLIVYITGVTVAAIAGSVHLMFSMDQKLDRKGGNSPHPHQYHPMPQGPPFTLNQMHISHRYRKSTRSPQTILQKTHNYHYTKTHSVHSQKFPHTHPHDGYLREWSNITSSQICIHLTIVVIPLNQVVTQLNWCILTARFHL